MKQKSALLFAVLLLLSLSRMAAAHAASGQPSRERDGNEMIGENAVPLPDFPVAEIVVEAGKDENGGVSARPAAEQILAAVESVARGEAVGIRIAVTGTAADTSTVSTAMPGEALEAVAETAGLEIVTDIGQMTLSGEAIASILERAGGEDVTFSMAREPAESGRELLEEVLGGAMDVTDESVRNGSVTEVVILSGDQRIDRWDGGAVTLKLPAGTGRFEQGKGYRVIQISADKSRTEHTGRCVTDAEEPCVEISITHLSTFVVLAGAVEEDTAGGGVPTAALPPAAWNSGRGADLAYIWLTAGLAFAFGVVAFILLRRSRKA